MTLYIQPTTPRSVYSIPLIASQYYFSPATRRFFHARITSAVLVYLDEPNIPVFFLARERRDRDVSTIFGLYGLVAVNANCDYDDALKHILNPVDFFHRFPNARDAIRETMPPPPPTPRSGYHNDDHLARWWRVHSFVVTLSPSYHIHAYPLSSL